MGCRKGVDGEGGRWKEEVETGASTEVDAKEERGGWGVNKEEDRGGMGGGDG